MNRLLRALILILTTAECCIGQVLTGRVVDAADGAGIADAIVTVRSDAVRTDRSGSFQIGVTEQIISARAPGYRRATFSPAEARRLEGRFVLEAFHPKALYLSVYGIGSSSIRQNALFLVHQGLINSFVIDVKGDRGIVPYPSLVPLVNDVAARSITTIPDLRSLIQRFHEEKIYLIARIVVFKDDPLATARPGFAVHQADGRVFRDREGLAWTDPFEQDVWSYNISVAREAAEAGFDEIQFDYVRFPDVASTLRFAQAPTQAARKRAILDFLIEARRQLTSFNVFIGVDVFGYVCWNTNDTGIGQQLEDIAELADYISPMLYPSCFQFGIPSVRDPVANPYQIVRNTLDSAQRRTSLPATHFRPWIQAFRDYAFDRRKFDSAVIRSEIQAADDFGSSGWMLWNPRNQYTDAFP